MLLFIQPLLPAMRRRTRHEKRGGGGRGGHANVILYTSCTQEKMGMHTTPPSQGRFGVPDNTGAQFGPKDIKR